MLVGILFYIGLKILGYFPPKHSFNYIFTVVFNLITIFYAA